MIKKAEVISLVVDEDMCTGCGVCVSECSSNALSMKWNKYGFWVPEDIENKCDGSNNCIDVCPFNPFPNVEVKTEDEIAKKIKLDTFSFNPSVGYYETIYAGYSIQYRISSSSGGIATYLFHDLMKKGVVDGIIVVNYSSNKSNYYQYKLIKSVDEIINSSKTRYYPVTMGEVLKTIENFNGNLAIVGVGCFIKAIRLKQIKNKEFDLKIKFLVGIICGGLKSKFYTDFLISKLEHDFQNVTNPEYRIKDHKSKASDYYFGISDDDKQSTLRMSNLGDMWGTGYFKSNACDFCEDVTTELADVSLGDAWLEPYVNDGRGNNVIIVRSKLAKKIVNEGLHNEKLKLDIITVDQLKKSQQGGFNHKHKGLKFRVDRRTGLGKITPPKRSRNLQKISIPFKLVQYMRQHVRQKTIDCWTENSNSQIFDRKLKSHLLLLKIVTKFYRMINKL